MPVALDLSDSSSRDGLPRVMGITLSSVCICASLFELERCTVTVIEATPDRKAATALRSHRLITPFASRCKPVLPESRRHAVGMQLTIWPIKSFS